MKYSLVQKKRRQPVIDPSSMAKKRKVRKKTRKTQQGSHLKRALFGLMLLAALTVAAGFWVHHLLGPHPGPPSVPKPPQKKIEQKIPFEVHPKDEAPIRKTVPSKVLKPPPVTSPDVVTPDVKPPVASPVVAKPGVKPPRAAIIIDDIGYDLSAADKLLALDVPMTFAVLSRSPFWHPIVNKARQKGIEIMLHLPMEPVEYPDVDPGPGALLASMSPDELVLRLNEHLDAIPFIKGVNNHMGSRLTTASPQILQIFTILKKRDLFFIDSLTHPKSVCRPSAKLFRIPFAQRDVFLDNIQEPAAIRTQIEELIRIAQNQGQAVGIGHPYKSTCQALYEALPDLRKKVELVPASAIVSIPE